MTVREKVIGAMWNIRVRAGQDLDIDKPYYSYDQGRYETYKVVLAWLDAEDHEDTYVTYPGGWEGWMRDAGRSDEL